MADKKTTDEFAAPQGATVGAVTREDPAAEAANQAALAAEVAARTETTPGGRYKVNGVFVNAEGEPVD